LSSLEWSVVLPHGLNEDGEPASPDTAERLFARTGFNEIQPQAVEQRREREGTDVYLIEILLPMFDAAGRHFPQADYDDIREELTGHFGGVTAFLRAPATGLWRNPSGDVQHDEIVIIEVMAESLDRDWWTDYRHQLQKRFRQDEVVIRSAIIERL